MHLVSCFLHSRQPQRSHKLKVAQRRRSREFSECAVRLRAELNALRQAHAQLLDRFTALQLECTARESWFAAESDSATLRCNDSQQNLALARREMSAQHALELSSVSAAMHEAQTAHRLAIFALQTKLDLATSGNLAHEVELQSLASELATTQSKLARQATDENQGAQHHALVNSAQLLTEHQAARARLALVESECAALRMQLSEALRAKATRGRMSPQPGAFLLANADGSSSSSSAVTEEKRVGSKPLSDSRCEWQILGFRALLGVLVLALAVLVAAPRPRSVCT